MSDVLTADLLRSMLRYEPATGNFYWSILRPGTAVLGSKAGTYDQAGYVRIGVCGAIYKAHRLAWLYVHGKWPSHEIDHINGIPYDNRIANLRDVAREVNQQNMRCANGRNGLLGATLHKGTGKWRARVWSNGRNVSVGLFDTEEEAHAAYVLAKRELHEGCTL